MPTTSSRRSQTDANHPFEGLALPRTSGAARTRGGGVSPQGTSGMRLRLHDPAYTDRLAAFLQSVGKRPIAGDRGELEIDGEAAELEVYLRVWRGLYPD